ncbi:hypothetical protein RTP6_000070 [Batrachochytrium dendrobatidis]
MWRSCQLRQYVSIRGTQQPYIFKHYIGSLLFPLFAIKTLHSKTLSASSTSLLSASNTADFSKKPYVSHEQPLTNEMFEDFLANSLRITSQSDSTKTNKLPLYTKSSQSRTRHHDKPTNPTQLPVAETHHRNPQSINSNEPAPYLSKSIFSPSLDKLIDAINNHAYALAYRHFMALESIHPTPLSNLPPAYYSQLITAIQNNHQNIMGTRSRSMRLFRTIDIFSLMEKLGVPTKTVVSVLKCMYRTYSMQGDTARMEDTLLELERLGVDIAIFPIQSLLISGYVNAGDTKAAMSCFHSWRAKARYSTEPYHALISAYLHTRSSDQVEHVVSIMRLGDGTYPPIRLTHKTYSLVARHYYNMGEYKKMEQWLLEYMQLGYTVMDTSMYTLRVSASNQMGDYSQAKAILYQMRASGIPFEANTYIEEFIAYCGDKADMNHGTVWTLFNALRQKRNVNKRVLVSMGIWIGPVRSEKALMELSQAIHKHTAPFETTMIFLVNAYSYLGDDQSVIQLIKRLEYVQKERFNPNIYLQLLHAYKNDGKLHQAGVYANHLCEEGVWIGPETWHTLLVAAAKSDPLVSKQIEKWFEKWCHEKNDLDLSDMVKTT